jgi:serine/threonine protein kinase
MSTFSKDSASTTHTTLLPSGTTGTTQGDDTFAGVPIRVGEFAILRKLGEGAFGQVFLACQTPLGRQVALKISRRAIPAEARGNFLRGSSTITS